MFRNLFFSTSLIVLFFNPGAAFSWQDSHDLSRAMLYYLPLFSAEPEDIAQKRRLSSQKNRSHTELLSAVLANQERLQNQLTGAREERLGMMLMLSGGALLGAVTYWDQTGADDGRPCLLPASKMVSGVLFLGGVFWFTWGQVTGANIGHPVLIPRA